MGMSWRAPRGLVRAADCVYIISLILLIYLTDISYWLLVMCWVTTLQYMNVYRKYIGLKVWYRMVALLYYPVATWRALQCRGNPAQHIRPPAPSLLFPIPPPPSIRDVSVDVR